MVAPRKYHLPDGRVVAWQCPLEFIPVEYLGGEANYSSYRSDAEQFEQIVFGRGPADDK